MTELHLVVSACLQVASMRIIVMTIVLLYSCQSCDLKACVEDGLRRGDRICDVKRTHHTSSVG